MMEENGAVPFRIGARQGKSIVLREVWQHWQEVAGFLAEGHCPNCGDRLERLEQWAHCVACNMCWQLGRDHETGDPTISWMHNCLHRRSFDAARFIRIDDLKALVGKHGAPVYERDLER